MKTIDADPLYIKTLSSQIRSAGGAGFNCDTEVIQMPSSYSKIYRFATLHGHRQLRTPNTFEVGSINRGDREHTEIVEYCADALCYYLITFNKSGVVFKKRIAQSYDQMEREIERRWSNHRTKNLMRPPKLSHES